MIELALELYGLSCLVSTVAFLAFGWARGRAMTEDRDSDRALSRDWLAEAAR